MKIRVIFRLGIAILAVAVFGLVSCESPTGGGGASVITIGYIWGVAPAAGETPVTRITENEQYSGTVTWNDNPSVFAAYTQYIATITLTAKTGYTLNGVKANFFAVEGATRVSNNANSGVITAVFPAIEPINLIIIAPVKNAMPSTTADDSDGMGRFTIGAVSWRADDFGAWSSDNPFLGSTVYTAEVTLTANSGYTFDELSSVTVNGQNAEVSDNTGTTLTLYYTFPATSEKTAIKIEVITQPTKLTYMYGERLDFTGLVAALTYDDGTTEDVYAGYFAYKNITANPTEGIAVYSTHDGQSVKITYGNLTCNTGNLTVIKATFTNIAELETYLWHIPANTSATPYIVTLKVDDISTLSRTIYNLYSYNKYVYLDLSDSTFTSIGAFGNCTSLTGITIPDSVTNIGDLAFYGCTNLSSVTLGNGTTSIGERAFYNCANLSSVTLGSGVTSIGDYAFANCTYLSSITIPDSVTSMGRYAFSGCTGLASVTIENGVESIGASTFSDCTSLTSVTIPDSITNIGNGAFQNCKSLTSVTIPDSVESIGGWAFEGCTSLASVTLPTNTNFTSIRDLAFYGCTDLTSMTIPNSVESIGQYVFYGCTSLNLTKYYNPSLYVSGTDQSRSSFYSCVKTVIIPNSVTSISSGAFSHYTSLTTITVDIANTAYSSDNGVLYNKDKTQLIAYPTGKTGAFTIPNSVESIRDYAFYGCTSLTSVTVPDSVTDIGWYAFYGCTNLTSVTFGKAGILIYAEYFVSFIDVANSTSLKTAYTAGGIGTYTRTNGGTEWTKQ